MATAIWNIGFDAGTAPGALFTGLPAVTALGVPGVFTVAATGRRYRRRAVAHEQGR